MITKGLTAAPALILCLTSAVALAAQDDLHRFRIVPGKGVASGSEEYRLTSSPEGRTLSGKTRVEQQGRVIEFSHSLSLADDWAFRSYRLESEMMGQTQTVEAAREADLITMKGGMGSQVTTRTAKYLANTIVLDNMVAGHYQVLLNRLAAATGESSEWSVLVPQRLASLAGKVTRGGVEQARCDDKPCSVRRYSVQLASVIIDFWADTADNRLMRIFVPMQAFEMIRLGFTPAAETDSTSIAGPKPESAVEREVRFPSAGLEFPAVFTLPAGSSSRVPVIVLVHGSGPHDRDETIGPNKPFRDLALGLAARGIATLRYDKRTYAFKSSIDAKKVTVGVEVIDDALAALQYAARLPEVDPDRVILLGHSLGGMMAPFIAARFPSLSGVVLMAATARPLDELMYEQIGFQLKLAGTPEAEVSAKLAEVKASFGRIRSGAAPDDEMVMFAPASYWRDLFKYNVQAELGRLKPAVLVLQGGKDVQVRQADYDLIEKALEWKATTSKEFHWFPELNHLFMKVEGEPTAAEYGRAGKVDEAVIEIVATWAKKTRRQQ
jgi:uncharacterized protein